MPVKAVPFATANPYDKRYAIADTETGAILDDAQGYGYKTQQKAYAGYSYKQPKTKQQKETQNKKKKILLWLKNHEEFKAAMEQYYFEIECKKSWGSNVKFNSDFVEKMLKDFELNPDFSPKELLNAWSE